MSQNHRLLAMTNIRQRKMDPSPSSRGSHTEDMIRIVIDDSPISRFGFDESENNTLEFDSYHYTPQPPRMITDKQYKNFLQGKPLDPKEQATFCPTGPECASLCISFSWIAFAFLIWVGFMIDTQPIFIKGVQPKGKYAIEGVTFNVRTENQHLPACDTAYHAAYAYLVTIFLCWAYHQNCYAYLAQFFRRRRRRREDYRELPDATPSLPVFHHQPHVATNPVLFTRCFIILRNLWQRCCRRRRNVFGTTKRRQE